MSKGQAFVTTRDGLKIFYRPGTSDIKAIKEACANLSDADDPILPRKVSSSYERVRAAPSFRIAKGDKWIDCGAQIGSFTVRALKNGAERVVSVEPESSNIALLERNIKENCDKAEKSNVYKVALVKDSKIKSITLYKTPSTYKHSLLEKVKHTGTEQVKTTTLSQLLKLYPDTNAVKVDIEGMEKDVLESVVWSNTKVEKLIYEYSCDYHTDMNRFHDLADYMKRYFKTVYFKASIPPRGDIWDTKVTRGANGVLVWCVDPIC